MKCQDCGNSIRQSKSWRCRACWRVRDKEVEIPNRSALREMSWSERALVFLHCAGQDISEYFDTRLPLPVVEDDAMSVIDGPTMPSFMDARINPWKSTPVGFHRKKGK